MVIKPRVRGFICVTTHPVGCEAAVKEQIDYIKARPKIANGPKKVLVIGASTGYGLAARITAAFGSDAATLGVFFERPGSESKPGTAGWYNSAAFHKFAGEAGLYAKSVNGDAFSDEVKQKVIEIIKADLGQVDQVVYSLAAPRRKHPKTGEVISSTLKPIGAPITLRGLDTDKEVLTETTLQPATAEEIAGTVAVMGGEDWQMWIDALLEAGVLAEGATTTAFTYVGEEITQAIYWNGSIGAAKKDLDQKVLGIRGKLAAIGGDARVSVLKAVVTQASSAIPTMPLYLSLLFKVMKEQGTHEGCIEQLDTLYDILYNGPQGGTDAAGHIRRELVDGKGRSVALVDEEGRLRADYKEMAPEVQGKVLELWPQVTNENLYQISDLAGYKADFLRLFGFGIAGVDYDADVNPDVAIPDLVEV
ncbi:trans-2-enoyl-CoA reductase family protein [Flavobacterium sp. MXW15]|uniref:Enoyl-[acyl-carrier-protein] reductase [NADH] n=1 Tax=Xanthomonas chitinilytica TaxID=2989819 RepID=A0ABT3JZE2_9XANT|nr:enoyl-ACP reductase FabV [Xanthomonas sp. H13-6]MCW4454011.1 trans-2-enoyl-CoA reductase family protein [Flavobacterium sp. MXW15]MCW4473821.1 trans-2-enoyl-CoA reductase family protein [Xanthomonas sp. H13-6]